MLKSKDFEHIKQLIENKEKMKLRVDSGFNKKRLSYLSPTGSKVFEIKWEKAEKFSICYMSFRNQRKGLGTDILNLIIDFAKQRNILTITVENATTRAMIEFCKKHDFEPVEGEVFIKEDGMLYGNYELSL